MWLGGCVSPEEVIAHKLYGAYGADALNQAMTCAASPDWDVYRAQGERKNGLVARLAAGRMPGWLTPAGRVGDVAVYRLAAR